MDKQELEGYIFKIEDCAEVRKEHSKQMMDLYKELKDKGYNVNAVREIIRLRAMNDDDVAMFENCLDQYKKKLDMD